MRNTPVVRVCAKALIALAIATFIGHRVYREPANERVAFAEATTSYEYIYLPSAFTPTRLTQLPRISYPHFIRNADGSRTPVAHDSAEISHDYAVGSALAAPRTIQYPHALRIPPEIAYANGFTPNWLGKRHLSEPKPRIGLLFSVPTELDSAQIEGADLIALIQDEVMAEIRWSGILPIDAHDVPGASVETMERGPTGTEPWPDMLSTFRENATFGTLVIFDFSDNNKDRLVLTGRAWNLTTGREVAAAREDLGVVSPTRFDIDAFTLGVRRTIQSILVQWDTH